MAKKNVGASDETPDDKLGSYAVDCTDLRDFVAVVKPKAKVGKHYVQEGFEDAVKEIRDRQAEWGEDAGITNADFDKFQEDLHRRAMIKAKLPAAKGLVSMLEGALLLTEDRINRRISNMAKSAEGRASTDEQPELLSIYAETRKYRSVLANKAVKTRRKNEAAAAAAEAAAAASTASATAPTPAASATAPTPAVTEPDPTTAE